MRGAKRMATTTRATTVLSRSSHIPALGVLLGMLILEKHFLARVSVADTIEDVHCP